MEVLVILVRTRIFKRKPELFMTDLLLKELCLGVPLELGVVVHVQEGLTGRLRCVLISAKALGYEVTRTFGQV